MKPLQLISGLNTKKKRIWEIDFLRGLCILLMVFDHIMISVFLIFGDIWSTVDADGMYNFLNFVSHWVADETSIRNAGGRLTVLIVLFGICGLSTSFSRSNFKRGIQLLACAMVLTLGSYLGEVLLGFEDIFIRFGVLHMLAFCILIWAVIAKIFKNPIGRSGVAITIGVVLLFVEQLLIESHIILDDTSWLLLFSSSLAEEPGIFSPGDYFPLLPNISYFLIGAGLAVFLYPKRHSLFPILDGGWSRPIEFLGRHTLFIMMVHLVLIELVLFVITLIIV